MNESNLCYHYCSVPAFVSIIRNRKFRLGNVFFMNDYKEVSWFYDLVSETITSGLVRNPIESSSGEREDSDAVDEEILVDLLMALDQQRFGHVYAGCFSTESDDLSQWRGYAADGRGVTLGLDLDTVKRDADCKLLDIVEVRYIGEGEVSDILGSYIKEYLVEESSGSSGSSSSSSSAMPPHSRILRRLAHEAPCYKNPAFKAEREVRLLVRTQIHPEDPLEHDDWNERWFQGFPAGVEFADNTNRLVPFTKVSIPASAVRRVGFGPRLRGHAEQIALRLFVRKHFPRSEVDFYESDASYR